MKGVILVSVGIFDYLCNFCISYFLNFFLLTFVCDSFVIGMLFHHIFLIMFPKCLNFEAEMLSLPSFELNRVNEGVKRAKKHVHHLKFMTFSIWFNNITFVQEKLQPSIDPFFFFGISFLFFSCKQINLTVIANICSFFFYFK